jgi:hypothetical protein
MRSLIALVCLVVVTGCDHPTMPLTAPSVSMFPVAAPPPAGVPVAKLELRNLRFARAGEGWYDAKFVLVETSGISGAVITSVTVIDPRGNSEIFAPGCWRTELRVAAGGALDVFETGVGMAVYCRPGASPSAVTSELRVSVTFVDDSGTSGQVSAIARNDD